MCHELMHVQPCSAMTPLEMTKLLLLIGLEVPEAMIATWSATDKRQVTAWAAALYVADGRPVYIPPTPDVVRPHLDALKGD